MNFIEMLYKDKVYDYINRNPSADYQAYLGQIVQNEEKILRFLEDSEDMKLIFNQLIDTQNDLLSKSNEERFADGFRLGAMCMMDLWVSFEEIE